LEARVLSNLKILIIRNRDSKFSKETPTRGGKLGEKRRRYVERKDVDRNRRHDF